MASMMSTIGAPTGRPPDDSQAMFHALFAEHWPAVRHHVNCFVDDGEAEDIVAEVFQIAWAKLKPEAPWGRAWLLRVADNKLRNGYRRSKSRARAMAALEHALVIESEPDALDVLALRVALRSLNRREQAVIVLTYWDLLSAGEVAETLRLSQAAVWKILSRARKKLRELLEEGGDDGR